jgi:hypothetical protein
MSGYWGLYATIRAMQFAKNTTSVLLCTSNPTALTYNLCNLLSPSLHPVLSSGPFGPKGTLQTQQNYTHIKSLAMFHSLAHVSDALGVKHLVAQFGLTLTST